MSSSLAALTPTSSITTTTINGVANADGVAVLTVPLSTLNSLTGTLSFTGCLALNLTTPCDGVILVTNTDTSNTTFKNSSLSYGALTSAQKNLIWVFEPPRRRDYPGRHQRRVVGLDPRRRRRCREYGADCRQHDREHGRRLRR